MEQEQGAMKQKYNLFSLFIAAVFHKVAANTELVNIEPLLLGEI